MLIELDVFGTLTAASLVLLAGRKLVASWGCLLYTSDAADE